MASSTAKITLRHATMDDMPKMIDIAVASAMELGYSNIMFPERLEPDETRRRADERATHEGMHVHAMREDKERLYILAEIEDETGKDIAGWVSYFVLPDGNKKVSDGKVPAPPMPASLDMELLGRRRKVEEEVLEKALGKDGTAGMYSIQPLSVASKHQGKGVGTMLLKWGTDRAQAEGRDIFVGATDAGLRMYEKAGFRKIGEVTGFGATDFSLMLWEAPRL